MLDTNVISEIRRTKPHGAVAAWLESVPNSSIYVSAVTFGELQVGIENTRATDSDKAVEIEAWVDGLMAKAQIISPDASIFRLWAKLMRGQSKNLYEDALIAATAIQHQLIVVTRNERDFKDFGVSILNPFTG